MLVSCRCQAFTYESLAATVGVANGHDDELSLSIKVKPEPGSQSQLGLPHTNTPVGS